MFISDCIKAFWNSIQYKSVSSESKKKKKEDTPKPSEVMRFLLNDPETPQLYLDRTHVNRPKACLPFVVKGYVGNQIEMGTDAWRAAQAHYVYLDALHVIQPAFKRPPKRWPGTRRLMIIPDAGRDLNAYYDRQRLCFFHDTDPGTKKQVYTVESVDIVAHELGHALLDASRPDLWDMQALEVWSYHEAYADIVAMLTVMKHEKTLKYLLKQTGGDLTRNNVVESLGEEMGTALYHLTGGRGGYTPGALRHANNKFNYIAPEKLPTNAPNNKLAAECHSFGRVFLGAFYEIMVKVYQHEVENGHDQLEALKRTRHLCAKWLARGSRAAPASPRFYDAVAKAMIGVDRGLGGNYGHIMKKVFDSRKILSRRRVKAQSVVKLDDLDIKETDIVEEYNDLTVVTQQSTRTLRLSDHFGLRAQGNNPLYDCELVIPNDTYMEFDDKGNMVDSVAISPRVALNNARHCVKILHEEDMVAYTEDDPDAFDKQFSVKDGKLVRNFFI